MKQGLYNGGTEKEMQLKYGLDDSPKGLEMIIYGLQWFIVSIPALLIIGKLIATMQYADPGQQIIYIQKLIFVTSIVLIAQVLRGHRLPVVLGPATVLLIGIIASQGARPEFISTSIFIGGLLLALVSFSGIFAHVQKLFTVRVVSVILILIAFTLSPVILNLIFSPESVLFPLFNLSFAVLLCLGMFIANKMLKGVWKATVVVGGILFGSIIHTLLLTVLVPSYSVSVPELPMFGLFFEDLSFKLALDPGVLLSFLFCYLALSINDLGSIQSVGSLLDASSMEERVRKGVGITGLGNVMAGLFGVVGPVNFSFSPGLITATGCASRYSLLPAGIGLFILSFLPAAVNFISSIPSVVIGSVLVYLMSAQIASGLLMLAERKAISGYNEGLIVGFPILIATMLAFIPSELLTTFPPVLRPIIGNGFVMGVIIVILLEHLILKTES
ncbi:solute carrier family 23 protein [Methanosarcina hadiensis]|uniref:uracil-xanthine permease family protein n=1 Tax=Methanosarcina hadiensis TaxID=3078083 RepID=UPI00397775A5